jgi:acyl-CoA reductase-like NAD-dependent aldehyde dehydrogenase
MDRYGLWIDGQGRHGRGDRRLVVENPYDRSVVAEMSAASQEDVQEAIDAADRAFKTTMRALPAYERARILRRAGQLIADRRDELARTVVQEVGKPIRDARREIGRAAELFDLAADEARRIEGEVVPMDVVPDGENRWGFAMRVPVGPVAAISPFNSPVNLSVNKVAPALAAGNSVVLKPASKTPLTVLALAEIVHEAGLPAGALNVVVGSGGEVGDPLVKDDRMRMVSFTGGVSAGLHIKQNAGIKRVTLELGSSSANIVCADADLDAAAKSLATSAFLSSGQACISAQRLIVHESVLDDFLGKLIPIVEGMKIGDPMDEATEIGPMISEDDVRRILKWIEEAKSMGARLLTGGERVGNTVRPTLAADVPAEASLACEEAFGPVATVASFRGLEEAAELANSSIYGLQAGVFTRDIATMLFLARELEVGAVWVNDSSRYRQDNYPFGGRKLSGLGREGAKYAVEDMTELKFIGVKLGPGKGIL